jgi:hypothetical protein
MEVSYLAGSEIILCYAVARRHTCRGEGGSDMWWRSMDGNIQELIQPLSLASHTVQQITCHYSFVTSIAPILSHANLDSVRDLLDVPI